MQLKDFDINKWEKSCRLYDKNHEGLKFDVTLKITDGKMSVHFVGLDKKYEEPIKKIMVLNMQGAVQYLYQLFDPQYAFNDEDYERLCKENFGIMKQNTELYLTILFKEGFDSFLSLVQQQTNLLHVRYELSKVEFSGQEWRLPNGYTWNGEAWTKDGNPVFSVLCDPIWETLLGNSKAQQKEEKIA